MTDNIEQHINCSNNELLADLKSALDYNPETGLFHWRVAVAKNVRAGSIAGSVDKQGGRLYIRFRRKDYLAYRLAWLLTYGNWPEGMIDHVDGNSLNNRIDNLRDVSRTVNGQNQRRAQSSNKTGLLGVSWHKNGCKFVAQIQIDGKKKYLGLFTTAEAAHSSYLAAKRKYHEGCTI